MPSPTKGPRLGGGPAHERLILANLATALFQHDSITTTEAKAKRVRPLAERLITFAKRGDLHARRRVMTVVRDKSAVHRLFAEIAPDMADRPGGYTRITKIGPRKGDNAPMAVIELVREPIATKATVKEAEGATKRAAKDAVATDAAIADEDVTDEVIADEVIADEVIADEVIADEDVADEVIADEDVADEVVTDKDVTDEVVADEVIADDDVTDAQTADQAASPELTLDDAATDAPATEAAGAVALPKGALAATEDGAAPDGYPVKGNADSGKYHVPGSQWYDATVAEFWFASAEDAKAAGFEPAGGEEHQKVEDTGA